MIKEILQQRRTKCKRRFEVLLADEKLRESYGNLKIQVIFGKVEDKKIPYIDRYTKQKVVVAATDLYGKPWIFPMRLREDSTELCLNEENFRYFAESEIKNHSTERDAIIQTIRELTCDVYEDTAGAQSVHPKTIFTQIMLSLITGDKPPTPPVRGSPSPLHRTRKEIQKDFIAGASSERVKRLEEEI